MSREKQEEDVALKAGVWYVISSILVRSISIITTPIFTRLMSTAEYGTVSTFISWGSLLLPFFTLNLTFSIGRAKLDFPGKIDEFVGSMQLLSAIVSFSICVVVAIFLSPISKFLELEKIPTIFLMIYLFFMPAIEIKQKQYKYKYQYKQNIVIAWYIAVATVVFSFVFMFFLKGNMAIDRILGIVIASVLLSIAIWIKEIKNHNLHISTTYWKYALAISLPLILHNVSMNILSQSDRIFISKICGTNDTAIYSLVYSYGIQINVVTSAISNGWLPWFHDNYFMGNYEEIKKNTKKLVLLGCYIALACIAFAPEAIVVLGGEKYASGVQCILPIVLGITCQFLYSNYVNIELHLKKTKYVSYGTIFAAGLNIVLNAIFIPKYGYVAASYTTLASYLALLLIHFFITKTILKVNLYNDKFIFLAMIVTGIIATGISMLYNYRWIRYVVILVGFVSFVFVFREYIFSKITNILKKQKN